MNCPNCNVVVEKSWKHCPECGQDLRASYEIFYFCPHCRANRSKGTFCTDCGTRLEKIRD